MKHLILPVLLFILTVSCSNKSAGTEIEVNTGSIFGTLLTNDKKIEDTVIVSLYFKATDLSGSPASVNDDPVASVVSGNGTYRFENVDFDKYRVAVFSDSLIVGISDIIDLNSENPEQKHDIAVAVIIDQTFNISIDNSTSIAINNFTINNGKVSQLDSAFILSFPDTDTTEFEMEITDGDSVETVTARIIMDADGIARFEIVKSELDIALFPGTSAPDGIPGPVTITVEESGTLTIESTFKTEDMPKTEL